MRTPPTVTSVRNFMAKVSRRDKPAKSVTREGTNSKYNRKSNSNNKKARLTRHDKIVIARAGYYPVGNSKPHHMSSSAGDKRKPTINTKPFDIQSQFSTDDSDTSDSLREFEDWERLLHDWERLLKKDGIVDLSFRSRHVLHFDSIILFVFLSTMFQEMHKRDKNRVVNLLQPVSNEFEPNGYYPIYGMTSSSKKGPGHGFLGESEKNDYNWLKTPPATPLFPSLEMEKKIHMNSLFNVNYPSSSLFYGRVNSISSWCKMEIMRVDAWYSRSDGSLEAIDLYSTGYFSQMLYSRTYSLVYAGFCFSYGVWLVQSKPIAEFLLFEREYCIWKMELLDESAE
ncbi:hypothetical protein Tco_1336538 [Tanacetum coccineum]